jgi:hypothetical protein
MKDIRIGHQTLGSGHPPLVIAELSGTSSLSTCRVITLVDQGGQPSILGTALRIVAGKNFTDNFRRGATGNLWASLDVREGRITDVYAPVAGAAAVCAAAGVDDPWCNRVL